MKENMVKCDVDYNLLQKIIHLKPDKVIAKNIQCEEILKNKFSAGEEVVLYGAGRIGKLFKVILEKQGVKVKGMLDKNAVKICKEDVFLPEDYIVEKSNKSVTVLITLCQSIKSVEKIVSYLNSLGYKKIVYDYHLMGCFCDFSMYQQEEVFLSEHEEKIKMVYSMLADEHSKEIFCACLKHYVTNNVYDTLESVNGCQYFDVDIPFSKGYASFVDCGAYNGDTLTNLVDLKECKTYIGFEPDMRNFQELEECINLIDESQKPEEILLYPCALSDKNEYLSFAMEEESKSSSHIKTRGGQCVTVFGVKLDDVLKRKKIDFIKMDIEGAEIHALKGAKNIISIQNPDLAICVYHKVTDIWEIPIMLKEMCNKYSFYLRTYSPGAGETVLYATIKQDIAQNKSIVY